MPPDLRPGAGRGAGLCRLVPGRSGACEHARSPHRLSWQPICPSGLTGRLGSVGWFMSVRGPHWVTRFRHLEGLFSFGALPRDR